jgi:hypothetical protein
MAASRLWSKLAEIIRRQVKPGPASSIPNEARSVAQSSPIWEPSGNALHVIEEGRRKVIGHYQEVLRTQVLTGTERAMIEEPIAREEVALHQMTQRVESEAA